MSRERPFPDKSVADAISFEKVNQLAHGLQVANERNLFQREATWVVPADYPKLPIGILFSTDIHYGGGINYQLLEKHLALVTNTPNLYVIIGGDFIHNMTRIGKAEEDLIRPEMQALGLFSALHALDKKLKLGALQVGDHDGWNTEFVFNHIRTLAAPVFPISGGVLNAIHGNCEYLIGLIHKYPGRSEPNITYAGKQALQKRFIGVNGVFIGNDHRLSAEMYQNDAGGINFVISGGTYMTDNGSSVGACAGMTLMLWPDKTGYAIMGIEEAAYILNNLAQLGKLKKSR